jgi:hypothetical protein
MWCHIKYLMNLFFLDQKLLQEHFVSLQAEDPSSQSQLLFLQRAALVVYHIFIYASVQKLVYNSYVMHNKLSKWVYLLLHTITRHCSSHGYNKSTIKVVVPGIEFISRITRHALERMSMSCTRSSPSIWRTPVLKSLKKTFIKLGFVSVVLWSSEIAETFQFGELWSSETPLNSGVEGSSGSICTWAEPGPMGHRWA